MTLKPGIHSNLPADEYFALDAFNASAANTLLTKSPYHAWFDSPFNPAWQRKSEQKFDMGSAVDNMLLDKESKIKVLVGDSRRTKIVQSDDAEARKAGLIPLLPKEYEQAKAIVDAIKAQLTLHPEAAAAFEEGETQETMIWQEGGLLCKARNDWRAQETIWDLKVTAVKGPAAWARHCFDMGYDVRQGVYRRGMKAATGVMDPKYRFLCVEASPPHAIWTAALSPAATAMGDAKAHRAIEIWQWCVEHDTWPAYPAQTCYVDAPPWIEADFEMQKTLSVPEQLALMMEMQKP